MCLKVIGCVCLGVIGCVCVGVRGAVSSQEPSVKSHNRTGAVRKHTRNRVSKKALKSGQHVCSVQEILHIPKPKCQGVVLAERCLKPT